MAVTCQKTPLSCSVQSQVLFYMSGLFCLGWRLCGFPCILRSAALGTLRLCEYSVDKIWRVTYNQKVILQRSCVFELNFIHSALTHSVGIRDSVFPRSQMSEFLFPCSKCFSWCLSCNGMCSGKFSTPLRPSRKKEAFWLLLQNDSLASARLTASQTKTVLFVRRSTRIFAAYPSGWPTLYDRSALIRTHSLRIIFEIEPWDGNKHDVTLKSVWSCAASLRPQWQPIYGERLALYPFCYATVRPWSG